MHAATTTPKFLDATAEDRQWRLDAGASEYIVKGDFDQKHFIQKVAELFGAI